MTSEGTLLKWTGENQGLMKDDEHMTIIQFSTNQFLKRDEVRKENLGRRCRYVLRTTGKNKLEAHKIRLLPFVRGSDKMTKPRVEFQERVTPIPHERLLKQKGKCSRQNQVGPFHTVISRICVVHRGFLSSEKGSFFFDKVTLGWKNYLKII